MRDDDEGHAVGLEEVTARIGGRTMSEGAGAASAALHAGLCGFRANPRGHLRPEDDEPFPRSGA